MLQRPLVVMAVMVILGIDYVYNRLLLYSSIPPYEVHPPPPPPPANLRRFPRDGFLCY